MVIEFISACVAMMIAAASHGSNLELHIKGLKKISKSNSDYLTDTNKLNKVSLIRNNLTLHKLSLIANLSKSNPKSS